MAMFKQTKLALLYFVSTKNNLLRFPGIIKHILFNFLLLVLFGKRHRAKDPMGVNFMRGGGDG